MNKMLCIMLSALVLLVGCDFIKPSIKSMNIQRSGIRGSTDTATTVALEAIGSDTEAAQVKEKLKEVSLAIQLFLKEGKVSDLTLPEITQELEKIIPVQYRFLVDIAIAQIQGIVIDVDKIGVNNVERINSACVGIIRGCDLYDMKYRPVKEEAVVSTDRNFTVSDSSVNQFGRNLKKELDVK